MEVEGYICRYDDCNCMQLCGEVTALGMLQYCDEMYPFSMAFRCRTGDILMFKWETGPCLVRFVYSR